MYTPNTERFLNENDPGERIKIILDSKILMVGERDKNCISDLCS
jgi:dTDP-4-dehydrorhamnose 3,5-epimerase-like enzyme